MSPVGVQIGDCLLTELSTSLGPRLKIAVPGSPVVDEDPSAALDRREVEELRDVCDRYLAGEAL